MKSTLIRYVIIALIFAVAVSAIMLYIGGSRFVLIEQVGLDAVRPEGGYKISLQALFLGAVLATLAIIGIWSFVRMLLDIPTRLRSGVSKRKRGKALEAMEDALIAASAGDADQARKKAARASALIDRPTLGKIVTAQAAEVSGNPADAQAHYKTMLDDEKTRKVAQRGLATLAYNRGDMATAISHAQQAYSDNKEAKWAFDILFGAKIADGQWDAAIDMPGFAPGVARAARLLVKSGDRDKAAKLIEKAWGKAPHPALSMAYRDLMTAETPKARAKRMKGLIKQNSGHRESEILKAEEAMASGDGVTAWGLLSPMVKDNPSARLCALAAKAEDLCDNPKDAKLWVAKAATAPSEPDWSDLDPEGTAFNYSDGDWRRLIFSFGDPGELIHPRHERFEKERPAIDLHSIQTEAAKPDPVAPAPKTPEPIAEVKPKPDIEIKAPSPDVIL